MGRKNKRRRSDYDRPIHMNKYIDQIGRKKEKTSGSARTVDVCTQPKAVSRTAFTATEGKRGMTLVNFMNIPAELRTACRFCVWKFEKRSGKKTKIPYNPKTGEKAKSNDARIISDFRTAAATYAVGG